MLDILFSLRVLVIVVLISGMALAMAYLCAQLQKQLLDVGPGEWLMDHVYCPLTRVLLLLLMALLVFPLIVETTDYVDLALLFTRSDFLIHTINILFVSSLLLTFPPVISHPAISLPLLGCIATALIFHHQLGDPLQIRFHWIPPASQSLRIIAFMLLIHYFSHWSSQRVSLWLDYRFNLTRTRGLIEEIHHLILQLPILLAYGNSLFIQLP